jgi:acyl-CoA thioester hydrolase
LTERPRARDYRRFKMNNGDTNLTEFPVIMELPVLWGDQDAFGHVNNLVYMKWAETCRVEYLRRIGMWTKLPPDGVAPILASISCSYRKPVTYPDTVKIGARVTNIGNSSMRMEHKIVSQAMDALVAEVDSTLVLLDYSEMKSVRIPDEMRRGIDQLEGNGR